MSSQCDVEQLSKDAVESVGFSFLQQWEVFVDFEEVSLCWTSRRALHIEVGLGDCLFQVLLSHRYLGRSAVLFVVDIHPREDVLAPSLDGHFSELLFDLLDDFGHHVCVLVRDLRVVYVPGNCALFLVYFLVFVHGS